MARRPLRWAIAMRSVPWCPSSSVRSAVSSSRYRPLWSRPRAGEEYTLSHNITTQAPPGQEEFFLRQQGA